MKRPQRGTSIVVALFVVVVVAALAAFAVTVGGAQQQTANTDVQASRALAAARTGLEWGAYRASASSCLNSQTLSLTEGALRGFRVVVRCSTWSHGSFNSYDIVDAAREDVLGSGVESALSRSSAP